MKDYYYEKLLNINTGGYQKETHKSFHYHPYEPTQYSALEILFEAYIIKRTDHVVDFGSGKGRLNFYINYFFNATVTGVEMNEIFNQTALENKRSYQQKFQNDNLYFYNGLAEFYPIAPLDNRFYFFNPFSKEIFVRVINNILQSAEAAKREIELILYYPHDDYIFHLEHATSFELEKEIRLPSFQKDPYERFLIYRLAEMD